MNNLLVSIVIPIYNVEEYLNECINSVINQTYKNIEIILVNDGSTDNCPQICDEYSSKDSRIKVIHKKNGGLSDARNYGIELATGEYICFIDSDDYVSDQYVEQLLKSAQKHNSDLVICDFEEFGNKDLIDSDSTTFYKDEVYDHIYFLNNILDQVPSHNSASNVVAWNKLIKKEKLGNLKFKVGMKHEDVFFIHHLLFNTSVISIVNKKLYFYRQRETSISNMISDLNKYHAYLGIKDRRKFFKKYLNNELKNKLYKNRSQKLLLDLFYRTKEKDVQKKVHKEIIFHLFDILTNKNISLKIKKRLMKDIVRTYI